MNYFVIKNIAINRFEYLATVWDLDEVNKISHWQVTLSCESKKIAQEECDTLNNEN